MVRLKLVPFKNPNTYTNIGKPPIRNFLILTLCPLYKPNNWLAKQHLQYSKSV